LAVNNEHTEIVQILTPFTDKANAPNAFHGYIEIVKILAPLTDNPNAPNKIGDTPIYLAACNGHTEIVKILVPLADHLNVITFK